MKPSQLSNLEFAAKRLNNALWAIRDARAVCRDLGIHASVVELGKISQQLAVEAADIDKLIDMSKAAGSA